MKAVNNRYIKKGVERTKSSKTSEKLNEPEFRHLFFIVVGLCPIIQPATFFQIISYAPFALGWIYPIYTPYPICGISTQNTSIMKRFLKMLEGDTYRAHREVSYYADCFCATSKYLSEASKKISGYPSNYWINRYMILDIPPLLRDKSLSFVQICDMFGFSSPAYFSRYV